MRLAFTLCVRPPFEGEPLPNTPVNVRVYVPFGVLLLVCTVNVLFEDAGSVSGFGKKEHVEPGGIEPQDRVTVPLNPFMGASVTLYEAFCPAFNDCSVGDSEIVKSITLWATPTETLGLKLLSPE